MSLGLLGRDPLFRFLDQTLFDEVATQRGNAFPVLRNGREEKSESYGREHQAHQSRQIKLGAFHTSPKCVIEFNADPRRNTYILLEDELVCLSTCIIIARRRRVRRPQVVHAAQA